MPFQTVPKDFRKCIKIQAPNNKFYTIKELFDLKCCFVQLSAELAKNSTTDENLIKEFNLVKETAKNDIYTDILNYINKNKLTRNDIKKYIMFWLFSRDYQRNICKKNINTVNLIDEYFKFKFPNYYKFVTNYKLFKSDHKLKSNPTVSKSISKLSIDCFNCESNIIFNELTRINLTI